MKNHNVNSIMHKSIPISAQSSAHLTVVSFQIGHAGLNVYASAFLHQVQHLVKDSSLLAAACSSKRKPKWTPKKRRLSFDIDDKAFGDNVLSLASRATRNRR
jgi:hypothetical protein